ALFNHLPIFLDDSQTAKDKTIEQTLYMIANGVGRMRGALRGTQITPTWRTVAFSTGERQLIDITEYEGARARTIELFGSPFESSISSKLLHDIKSVIHSNYGHAGEIFIKEITSKLKNEDFRKNLKQAYREKIHFLSEKGDSNIADRLAQYLSAVWIAGRLVEEFFGFGSEPTEVIIKIFNEILEPTKQEDIGKKALELIISWVNANRNFFDINDEKASADKGEIYGVIREGEYIGIFPHKFKDFLRKQGFSTSSILRIFKERDWIQIHGKHFAYPVGFRKNKVEMIKIIHSNITESM
ncbi:MAG: DUF927 domain-containing protein, partial [Candidatus Thermoplasmatota archaeon]